MKTSTGPLLFLVLFGSCVQADTLKENFVCWNAEACAKAIQEKVKDPQKPWKELLFGKQCFITRPPANVNLMEEQSSVCKIKMLVNVGGSVYGSEVFTPCDNIKK